MKVLVTGHHGYIGSVLVPYLAQAGHEVTGLDTFFYRGCDFGEAQTWSDERVGDVRDVTSGSIEGFEAVVHLAALSNDPLGDLSPQLTKDINLGGSIALAHAAREAGVRRFIFASSCSMYGAAATDDLLDESAPLRPLTPYAESKVRAEEALWELADDDFCVTAMRNATVFGVSPRLRLDIVLNNLAGWAVTTGSIRLLSTMSRQTRGRSEKLFVPHGRDAEVVVREFSSPSSAPHLRLGGYGVSGRSGALSSASTVLEHDDANRALPHLPTAVSNRASKGDVLRRLDSSHRVDRSRAGEITTASKPSILQSDVINPHALVAPGLASPKSHPR